MNKYPEYIKMHSQKTFDTLERIAAEFGIPGPSIEDHRTLDILQSTEMCFCKLCLRTPMMMKTRDLFGVGLEFLQAIE